LERPLIDAFTTLRQHVHDVAMAVGDVLLPAQLVQVPAATNIHISRAAELLSRQQMLKQPAVVLHELAHAYHDQVLGFDDPRIIEAYQQAMDSGLYDEVLAHDGRRVRHYAATDHKEYFAEGTEAYLYRNDFYPFVAAELAEHEPRLYKLLGEIWGPLGGGKRNGEENNGEENGTGAALTR
jgi:hypothetical protein